MDICVYINYMYTNVYLLTKLDTTEPLNWTELNWYCVYIN